jgi:hypothetical protein
MKIIYVILSVLILFVTSCQKEEPYDPPTYNKIPDPPVTPPVDELAPPPPPPVFILPRLGAPVG